MSGEYHPAQDARPATDLECYELFTATRELALSFVGLGVGRYYVGDGPNKRSEYEGLWLPDGGDTIDPDKALLVAQGPPTHHLAFTELDEDVLPFVPSAKSVLGLGAFLSVKFHSKYIRCQDSNGTVPKNARPERPECTFGIPGRPDTPWRGRTFSVKQTGYQRAQGDRNDLPRSSDSSEVPAQGVLPPPLMVTECRVLMDVIEGIGRLRRTARRQQKG